MSYVQDYMKEDLKDHVFIPLLGCNRPGTQVQGGYLQRPGTSRMMSTLILFTPEGIALMGDLTPERNGSISACGYGEQWFKGQLSEGYLCEKFLDKKFSPKRALASLRREILDARREGTLTNKEARDAWGNVDGWGDEFFTVQDYENLYFNVFENHPQEAPMDYDEGEAGWLCAIQQRYHQIYTPEF